MAITDNPIFTDADAARTWFETLLWPEGPICPHCGVVNCTYALKGKTTRPGLYKCKGCDGHFTVMVGTVMERSHIPLNKWALALHLMVSSKKGMSAHQMHRMLGLTYKTAWFMCMRIREAMREGQFSDPLGGINKVVEMDETYIGGLEKNKHRRKRKRSQQGGAGKEIAFALVEREGRVRSFHVPAVTNKTLRPILDAQVDGATYLMTDDASRYKAVGKDFAGHGSVNHSIGEYVRGGFWHTNTIENYFSVLKRGITGTYQHVSQDHLKRYLAEFDFRYNERAALNVTDGQRMEKAALGVRGKRVTYRRTREAQEAPQTATQP